MKMMKVGHGLNIILEAVVAVATLKLPVRFRKSDCLTPAPKMSPACAAPNPAIQGAELFSLTQRLLTLQDGASGPRFVKSMTTHARRTYVGLDVEFT